MIKISSRWKQAKLSTRSKTFMMHVDYSQQKKNKSIKPIDLENIKIEQGKSMNETYIESIILMLETGTEYLEDLKSVIKHMNNE